MEKLPVADYSLIRSEDENTSTKLETNSHTHPCFEESQQQNTEQKVKKHCISFPINAKVHCVRSSKSDDSGSTRKRYSIWEDEGSEAGDEKEGKNDKEQNSLKTSSTNKGKSNECSKSNRTSKFTNESRSSSSTNKDNSHDCSKTDSSKCSKSNRTSKFTNESRSSSSTNKDNSRNCSKTDSSKCSKSDRTCKFTNERRSSSSTNKDNSHNSSKTDRTSKFASEKKCEDKTRQGKNDKTDEQQKRHSLGKKDKMSISRDKERSRRNGRGDSKSSLTKSGTCEKKSVSDKKTHVTVKDMNKNKTQLVEDKGKKQTKSHHKKGKSSYISQLSKKGLKKFDCRSSWKSFKKIFFVCDARYCVEESVLKEYCNIPIQVLTKPNLKIDDIPNLLMSKIDAPNSCPNSLFICSVGTSDLIELQNIPSCQDLDHEPAKYICLKKVDGKGLAKEVILKSRKIKTELQKLLGPTTEVYFTSILPLSFQIYRDREIKKHNLVTEHELDLKIFKNDISKWEERLYEAMHSFNTYHAKNYPLHLSLQLATHAQCLGRELTNFYKVCTVDGLNLTRDICKDISVGIGKTLYKFCTWRGRYEKVIIVGDSRLEHIRKAWPGDMKYNCKFVTHPQLKLKDFKCKDELIIKELSSAKNSLIVIGVGMNDFSQLSSHSSCMCKARLKILIPRNHRHQRSIKFILAEARSYMKRAVSTLNKVTVNCDTVFMPFYGIDLIAHEDYRLRNHTSCDAYRRLLGYNAVSKNLLAMDILNEACYKYSKLNFLPIWDLFPLYPKAFVNNKYKKISSSILYDGIHPSPDIALKQAKMVYWKVNEALSIENVSDTKQKVPRSTFPISEITIIKECDLLRHHPESSVCYPEWSNEPTGDQHLYSFKEEDIQKESCKASAPDVCGGGNSVSSPFLSDISDTVFSEPENNSISSAHHSLKSPPLKSHPSIRQLPSHHLKTPGSRYTLQSNKQRRGRSQWQSPIEVSRYPKTPPVVQKQCQTSFNLKRKSSSRSPNICKQKYKKSFYSSSPEGSWSYSPPVEIKRKYSMQSPKRSQRYSSPIGRHYSMQYYSFGKRSLSKSPQRKRKIYSTSPERKYLPSPSTSYRLRTPSSSRPPFACKSPNVCRSSPNRTDESRSPSPNRTSSRISHEKEALRNLWNFHVRECAAYRKHPVAYPDYDKEFQIFKLRKEECIVKLGGDPNTYDITEDWERHWATRLEELLEENWLTKKEKCLSMLHKNEESSQKRELNYRYKSSSRASSSSSIRSESLYSSSSSSLFTSTSSSSSASSTPSRDSSPEGSLELPRRKRKSSEKKGTNDKSDDSSSSSLKCKNTIEAELDAITCRIYRNNNFECEPKRTELNMLAYDDIKAFSNAYSLRHKMLESFVSPKKTDATSVLTRTIDEKLEPLVRDMESRSTKTRIKLNDENKIPLSHCFENAAGPTPTVSTNHNQRSSKEEEDDEVSSTTLSYEVTENPEHFVSVLEMLKCMGSKLGILELPIKVLWEKALQCKQRSLPPSDMLKDKDINSLFILIKDKLNDMVKTENTSIIQKVVIQEASERLSRFLESSRLKMLDITFIAQKCLGKNESDTLSFIQSQFLELGFPEVSHLHLKEVYEDVKLQRSKLLSQILKQISVGDQTETKNPSTSMASTSSQLLEKVRCLPSMSGWSSDDSPGLSSSQKNANLGKNKHAYINAAAPTLPSQSKPKTGLLFDPSELVNVINSQSSVTENKERNVCNSLHQHYLEKTSKTKTTLLSSLDYGLASPCSKREEPERASHSQIDAAKSVAVQDNRKDPIRLVIPKVKDNGRNITTTTFTDDSGW